MLAPTPKRARRHILIEIENDDDTYSTIGLVGVPATRVHWYLTFLRELVERGGQSKVVDLVDVSENVNNPGGGKRAKAQIAELNRRLGIKP